MEIYYEFAKIPQRSDMVAKNYDAIVIFYIYFVSLSKIASLLHCIS